MIERLAPGERLPPEPALAKTLGVSRATVRDALGSFQAEGMLRRIPGAGTFATGRPVIRNDLAINAGVTELISSHGLTPGTVDLEVRREPASSDFATRLRVRRGTKLWVVDRTRTADGEPVIISRDVIPYRSLPNEEAELLALNDGSLYDLLDQRGTLIHHGVAWVRPTTADARAARLLRVKRGSILLRLVQVDYDAMGTPVVLSYEHHLPDFFEITILRRRQP